MKSIDILKELDELSSKESITNEELMTILKRYANIISVYDLMLASEYIREDGKYVQAQYRENYLETYVKYFIMRMKEVSVNEDYERDKIIDNEKFKISLPLLKNTFEKEKPGAPKGKKLELIYVITSLYTTFILEEPIHPVGSKFPGNLGVEERNGEFYCPVKDNQKDNENAICHLCLAVQTPDI